MARISSFYLTPTFPMNTVASKPCKAGINLTSLQHFSLESIHENQPAARLIKELRGTIWM